MSDLRHVSTKKEGYWPSSVDPIFRALYLSNCMNFGDEVELRMYLETKRDELAEFLDRKLIPEYETAVVEAWKPLTAEARHEGPIGSGSEAGTTPGDPEAPEEV